MRGRMPRPRVNARFRFNDFLLFVSFFLGGGVFLAGWLVGWLAGWLVGLFCLSMCLILLACLLVGLFVCLFVNACMDE